ncbi:hypothetical protein [Nitrosomonas ureae]|uniref:hypothetical protein n=1 Tax=Nitrosomonas ureae TaxID=44577 RepID=UPI000B0EB34C|nr:hypothetical protein [Nitrosomonas ureae]
MAERSIAVNDWAIDNRRSDSRLTRTSHARFNCHKTTNKWSLYCHSQPLDCTAIQ